MMQMRDLSNVKRSLIKKYKSRRLRSRKKRNFFQLERERIFGIGLSKTGTTSLNYALLKLDYLSVHYPIKLIQYNGTVGKFDYLGARYYEALTDIAVIPFYKELDRYFPNSKFILTIREDKDDWLESVIREFGKKKAKTTMNKWMRRAVYGTDGSDREKLSEAYDKHLKDVTAFFSDDKEHKLLVLNICGGDGWDKLCDFLKRPCPNTPFPHANQTAT